MFDFMIRILPNGRLLVRENASKTVKNMKATEISSYFENVLQSQIEAQDEEDAKVAAIKEQLQGSE